MEPPYDPNTANPQQYQPQPPPYQPPVPGYVPTINFGQTFSDFFKVLKSRILAFISIGGIATAIVIVPTTILLIWWLPAFTLVANAAYVPQMTNIMWAFSIGMGIIIVLGMASGWWASLACCALTDAELRGKRMGVGQAATVGMKRLGSLIPVAGGAGVIYTLVLGGFFTWIFSIDNQSTSTNDEFMVRYIVVSLLIVLLSVAAAVVSIVLTIRWFVALPVMVVEQTSIWQALPRSAKLTKGSRGMTFLLYFVVSIAVSVAAELLVLLISLVFASNTGLVMSSGGIVSGTQLLPMVLGSLLSGCFVAALTVSILPIISGVIYANRIMVTRLR